MAIVTITDLTGAPVGIDTTEVTSVTPVPVSALPLGTPAGSYIGLSGGTRVGVVGAVAAVILLLGGESGLIASGYVDGGVLQPGSIGIAGVTVNGVGDYSVTLEAPGTPFPAHILATVKAAGFGVVTIDQTSDSNVNVYVWDAAGLAFDADFMIQVSAAAT